MLGGRSRLMVAREILRVRNYRALVRMARVYPELGQALRRYFLGRGDYPYRCPVRTPAGIVAPTLYSSHDMFTVNEIFCREDYGTGTGVRTVVDVGSNIGLSALYFLTRDPACRCLLYEPVPRNVERLRLNLAAYEDRYTLHEDAVAAAPGPVSFGVEDTGRYGGIGVATGRTIEVSSVGSERGARAGARELRVDRRPQDRHRGHGARAPRRGPAGAAAARPRGVPGDGAAPGPGAGIVLDARFGTTRWCLTNRAAIEPKTPAGPPGRSLRWRAERAFRLGCVFFGSAAASPEGRPRQ